MNIRENLYVFLVRAKLMFVPTVLIKKKDFDCLPPMIPFQPPPVLYVETS